MQYDSVTTHSPPILSGGKMPFMRDATPVNTKGVSGEKYYSEENSSVNIFH